MYTRLYGFACLCPLSAMSKGICHSRFLIKIMCMCQRGRYLQRPEEGFWILLELDSQEIWAVCHGCWELNFASVSHLISPNFNVIAYII